MKVKSLLPSMRHTRITDSFIDLFQANVTNFSYWDCEEKEEKKTND
jgi:hypothetical protein